MEGGSGFSPGGGCLPAKEKSSAGVGPFLKGGGMNPNPTGGRGAGLPGGQGSTRAWQKDRDVPGEEALDSALPTGWVGGTSLVPAMWGAGGG